MLTQIDLINIMIYDQHTGIFYWKEPKRGRRKNGVVGSVTTEGYLKTVIDGKFYQLHRLAWLYMTGEFPEYTIDHKNNNRADNRFLNLRKATKAENKYNSKIRDSKTGYKGVSKRCGNFRATIGYKYKVIHIGTYKTPEEAAQAYNEKALELYGEFARLNIIPQTSPCINP